MNPIALINVNSGGLEGSIGFPIDNPSEKYLDGTGNWSTIQVPSAGGGGSGSRTRNVIIINKNSDITGGQSADEGVYELQHTEGTDSIVYVDLTEATSMVLPRYGNEGDRITLICKVLNNSYEFKLWTCYDNNDYDSREVYKTLYDPGFNLVNFFSIKNSTNYRPRGNFEFYRINNSNSIYGGYWYGFVQSMMY